MLLIKKGKEPNSLTEYKMKSNAYFDGYSNKGDIRKALLEEQGHLCAYCMKRISKNNMKIEHYNSQSNSTENEVINVDLNQTLNLNCEEVMLKRNRKAALDALKAYLSKKKSKDIWSKDLINKTLDIYLSKDNEGKLKTFNGIAIWYLKNKLNK